MSLLDDLNPVQRQAVLQTEGPLLVFAGAGSGKTRVLTYRIAYLIQEKRVPPWNILAVTFTNKAADEMRERADRLLGGAGRGAWISTFHSACVRILRRHIEPLGFQRNFVIYDDQDQERHLKRVMKELDLDFKVYPPQAMLGAIDHLKNEGVTPDQYRPSEYNIFEKRLALVFRRYQEDLRRNNALDFGDLLLFVSLLFKRIPEVLSSYQDLCRYVMVDEFQDTNSIQYDLIMQIAARHRNVCVVGDDDQSIYRWRGAEVGNILNFEKDFPGSKVITLEQNYRSTQNILHAANHMVRQNRLRREKVLWTENPQGESLGLYVARDEEDEAAFVVRKIMALSEGSQPAGTSEGGRPYRDMAVFYRMNAQSRAVEDELVQQRIPYTVVGGLKFYERREIKDILAYLKVIANPSDGVSLNRIVNAPPRGLGEKTMERMQAVASERGVSLYEAMRQALQEAELAPGLRARMEAFLSMIEELREEAKVVSLRELTLNLFAKTKYLERLKEEGTEEALSRKENLEELVTVITEFEQNSEEISLEAFLDKVSLVTDVDLYEDKGNRVSLMTLHCAKGLEFPVVFIVGVEEGLLPHHRRGDEIEDLEEERRLFYVGITRAKKRLFFSRAEKRSTFGVGRANAPSRFLDDLPVELIHTEERAEEEEEAWGFAQVTARDDLWSHGEADFPVQEAPPQDEGVVYSPEGFFLLKIGMRVRHPKFGEGRVKAVEGMDEDQKATVLFQTVGSKRLKVRYANLEILE